MKNNKRQGGRECLVNSKTSLSLSLLYTGKSLRRISIIYTEEVREQARWPSDNRGYHCWKVSNPDQIFGEYKLTDYEEDSNQLQSAGSSGAKLYVAIFNHIDDANATNDAYDLTHSF